VDQEIRRFNFEQLRDAGVCSKFEDVGTYIWHGGAHHVGYDVHDEVNVDGGRRLLEPGMVFCVDVGIYHEEWGIGFRLEDNCLITADGCENLSAVTPRSIQDIEDYMSRSAHRG
jgi:Xaa-Pro aminopeptidase